MKNNPQKFVVKLGLTRDPTRPADIAYIFISPINGSNEH